MLILHKIFISFWSLRFFFLSTCIFFRYDGKNRPSAIIHKGEAWKWDANGLAYKSAKVGHEHLALPTLEEVHSKQYEDKVEGYEQINLAFNKLVWSNALEANEITDTVAASQRGTVPPASPQKKLRKLTPEEEQMRLEDPEMFEALVGRYLLQITCHYFDSFWFSSYFCH